MSKMNLVKTATLFLAIALGVASILYARVDMGMSEQALNAWLGSATAVMAGAAAVVWIAVVWLFVARRAVG